MSGCGVSSERIGIGFVCVIGAGLATVAGALLSLLIPPKNELFLAAAVSFAGGRPRCTTRSSADHAALPSTARSFVDIYVGKAIGHFSDAGYSEAQAFTYATICFFCGLPISWALDIFSDWTLRRARRKEAARAHAARQADAEAGGGIGSGLESQCSQDSGKLIVPTDRSYKLLHMGLLTALAMALHNMPEGLVTFVGYIDNISSGITTAVAIAIHNFPEGIAIAASVYFGTGQRWKAILWASLSALSEPIGGLIGLAVVCGGSLTDTVFGILFGLVAGIMVYISLKELLPAARELDPSDRVSTTAMVAGMIVMACSLIAILYSAGEEAPEAAAETAAAVEAVVSGALETASP